MNNQLLATEIIKDLQWEKKTILEDLFTIQDFLAKAHCIIQDVARLTEMDIENEKDALLFSYNQQELYNKSRIVLDYHTKEINVVEELIERIERRLENKEVAEDEGK